MTSPQNVKFTLLKGATFDPNGHFKPKLLNRSVACDIDLSQKECGCVAIFYTVEDPATESDR